MEDGLNYKVDRDVVTYKFLRDLSNYEEECGRPKLGIDATEEAYLTFRENRSKNRIREGEAPMTDAELMGIINGEDRENYELTLRRILIMYSGRRVRQSLMKGSTNN